MTAMDEFKAEFEKHLAKLEADLTVRFTFIVGWMTENCWDTVQEADAHFEACQRGDEPWPDWWTPRA